MFLFIVTSKEHRSFLLQRDPTIGKKEFIVLELQMIKECFGSDRQTKFKVLKLLNISTEGIDRDSTKDVVDD